jgi:DNA-binding response OmpR family regulator
MSTPDRVLVVDDQPENLDLIEEVLREEGFAVSTAADGLAALRAVEEGLPDCVLLDVMMPAMDGFSVCRALKANRRTARIPVAMLTALTEVTDKILGLNVGADDFLNKPIDPWELVSRVRSLSRIGQLRRRIEEAETLLAAAAAFVEEKESLRSGHGARVATMAVRLARTLRVPDGELESVGRGALLHDVGDAFLPRGLRAAAAAGDEAARARLSEHPALGAHLLSGIPGWAGVRNVVALHHERRGGEGGSASEVVAVANRFDGLLVAGASVTQASSRLRSDAVEGAFRAEAVEALLANDVTLPVRPSDPQPDWKDVVPVSSRAPRGRVLLATDRRANREVLAEILQTAGHDVVSVEEADAVASVAREADPDLVVLDLSDGEGLGVCTELRGAPATRRVPVVVATSVLDLAAHRRAVRAGADDVLGHPIDRLELLSRVKSLLRLRVHARDLAGLEEAVRSLGVALAARDPESTLPPRLLSFVMPRRDDDGATVDQSP